MALKTFVSGEVLTAADTNEYLVNNKFARKTANESVTSSTALQDDDTLQITVSANCTYEITGQILYDGATGGDFKFLFAAPAGATLAATVAWPIQTGDATIGGNATVTYIDTSITTPVGALGAGSTLGIQMQGVLVVAGTAGTFKLTWAQDTSSGTATRVLTNSYLCLRRVE